jgi:site-specific DNA-cytosine methylase
MDKGKIVFSAFDGMSCGQIALERAGIKVDKYYASEIDKYAIQITQKNFPNTIQLGDITKWKEWSIDWASIDIVAGGSPCQSFSSLGDGTNFNGKSGLFFEFADVVHNVLLHNPNAIFLLENVVMKKEWEDIISKIMGVQPIMIDSALVSAQRRKRLYWTNIPNITLPENKHIYFRDILENGTFREIPKCMYSNYGNRVRIKGLNYVKNDKSNTLTTNSTHTNQYLLNNDKSLCRLLSVNEYEKLQTLPCNYTEGVSKVQRYKMIGNGWTVDVIAHIFSFLNK